jgi:hypothetical protein
MGKSGAGGLGVQLNLFDLELKQTSTMPTAESQASTPVKGKQLKMATAEHHRKGVGQRSQTIPIVEVEYVEGDGADTRLGEAIQVLLGVPTKGK